METGEVAASLTTGLLVTFSELRATQPGTFALGLSSSGRQNLGVALAHLTLLYELPIWAALLLVGVSCTLAAETLSDLVTLTSELDDMTVFQYGDEAKLFE